MNDMMKWLTATDEEVGPGCMHVPVPATIATDDAFREAYAQGYRHALADARAALRSEPNGDGTKEGE